MESKKEGMHLDFQLLGPRFTITELLIDCWALDLIKNQMESKQACVRRGEISTKAEGEEVGSGSDT